MARSAKKQEKNKNALEKQQKNTKKTTRHGVPRESEREREKLNIRHSKKIQARRAQKQENRPEKRKKKLMARSVEKQEKNKNALEKQQKNTKKNHKARCAKGREREKN